MPAHDHVFIDARLDQVRHVVQHDLGASATSGDADHVAFEMGGTTVDVHADTTFAYDPDLGTYEVWAEVHDRDSERQDDVARRLTHLAIRQGWEVAHLYNLHRVIRARPLFAERRQGRR